MEKKQKKENKEGRDPFFNLKYLAYCMSQQPANRSDVDLSDFVRFAKYNICQERGVLFWDPVWEGYTDEHILIEYYAILLEKDSNFREEFEAKISSTLDDSDVDWMDKMIEENQKEREAKAKEEAEADFDFKPDKTGD